MKKEIIICIVIVIGIILGDILIQKYTNNALDLISTKLSDMKENLKKSDEINADINEVTEDLDKNFNILSCFLEHNELEKIKTQLVLISAGIEIGDKSYIYEEINRTIYQLDHIKDKQSLKIDNIF